MLLEILRGMQSFICDNLCKNEKVNLLKPIFSSCYNLVMFILTNFDLGRIASKKQLSLILTRVNSILQGLATGPFEQYFESLYLLENGQLSVKDIFEVEREFLACDDDQKVTFFDYSNYGHNVSTGCFLTVLDLTPLVDTSQQANLRA